MTRVLLKPNEYFIIDLGIGDRPVFHYIEKIVLYGKDTIILNNKEKMTETFKKIQTRNYRIGEDRHYRLTIE